MFEIVLFEPEIAPNCGNVIRLCANTGCNLHLIEPLGFDLAEKNVRRAGLDYHDLTIVRRHPSFAAFIAAVRPMRLFGCTTKGTTFHTDIQFQPGDALLFGPETRGLPDDILAYVGERCQLRIPMVPTSRSLNLSNAVAVVTYEAWRQQGFAGAI